MIRDATEKEKQIFKEWIGTKDDLMWTRLHLHPFKLKITSEPINCTVLRSGPDEYTIDWIPK